MMKAVICPAYGSPDVLRYSEVAKPTPKPNEVLVKVSAAVVGPSDCAFRKGDPFMIRLIYGLNKPKIQVFGAEFAGEIDSVGSEVTSFKAGDQVYGISPDTLGAHAQYMAFPADKTILLKPHNVSFEDAVGIADGALTSLIFLRDVAR